MDRHFDTQHDAEFDADPDQVWDAIATGPGIDSWFMGRNDVEPGPDGTIRMAFGGYTPEHRITEWEPHRRLAYRTDEADDGRFVAYEFLIEGRDQASTTLRMTVSGFLPGDDWEAEYDAMTRGLALYFRTLAEYLTYFAGRTATPVTAFGPLITDWQRARHMLYAELGLPDVPRAGTSARFQGPESRTIDGTVYFIDTDAVGIRTSDAMYRFVKGFSGPIVAMHHVFGDVDRDAAEASWQTWLSRLHP
ncbi:SRPBCC family protein [Phytoactinopolyspora mesophila]|uniref:SRPBCC domain-containing protein n=1 Tax=Phytoactinopolyspora mesophila TaxID=2650750 RepID=A0A7K3M4S6_9ACTN|nr:SRPBCC domain-containing protein [Phytoactinopolyspora mesophila]NDL58255.1 SRPBCC domain-containing protein [Phytoactinopolyspora mesophila]